MGLYPTPTPTPAPAPVLTPAQAATLAVNQTRARNLAMFRQLKTFVLAQRARFWNNANATPQQVFAAAGADGAAFVAADQELTAFVNGMAPTQADQLPASPTVTVDPVTGLVTV